MPPCAKVIHLACLVVIRDGVVSEQHTANASGFDVHVDTITRWLEHYVDRVEKYTDTSKPPRPGEQWDCDEKQYDVNGKSVALMDLRSRFILGWDASLTKQGYNAAPLLEAAKRIAGKIPKTFIADGLV